MNVTGPIITLIAADNTANALLAGRVWPDVLKQSTTFPAAALNIVDNDPNNTKDSASDLDVLTLQVDVYGTTATQAIEADNAIRNAIDYKSSGIIASISYRRTISGFSELPELVRRISHYAIAIRR